MMVVGRGFASIVTLQYLIFAARRFCRPLDVPNGLLGDIEITASR
jgi:hypothetical protein